MGEFEKYFREEGLKEGLKKGIEEGRKAGVEEGRLNSVKALMKNAKVSAQEAMKILMYHLKSSKSYCLCCELNS